VASISGARAVGLAALGLSKPLAKAAAFACSGAGGNLGET
jgi:hypothetical protein